MHHVLWLGSMKSSTKSPNLWSWGFEDKIHVESVTTRLVYAYPLGEKFSHRGTLLITGSELQKIEAWYKGSHR
jgi:hypothetical protein